MPPEAHHVPPTDPAGLDVDPPRSVSEKERIKELLVGGGMQRLRAEAEGTWLYIPVLLALFLGLRRGEVLGLRWQDVDLKAGELRVEQALKSIRGKGLVFLPPKTEAALRPLRMLEFLVAELVKHKAAQAAHRLEMGPAWQDAGPISSRKRPAGRGLPTTWPTLTRSWRIG